MKNKSLVAIDALLHPFWIVFHDRICNRLMKHSQLDLVLSYVKGEIHLLIIISYVISMTVMVHHESFSCTEFPTCDYL